MTQTVQVRPYNYHTWEKYMVENSDQTPKTAHFAGVMFDSYSSYSPGYDRDESGRYTDTSYVRYFAFPTQELLTQWVAEATGDKKKFFIFKVEKLGQFEVRVNLDLDV